MTAKRFTTNGYYVYDNQKENEWLVNEVEIEDIVDNMNNLDTKAKERSKALSTLQKKFDELHEENMNLRAKHTQMIIIMKDVVKDLKRMDTYRYAEHLEKIANLHFLSEKELEE